MSYKHVLVAIDLPNYSKTVIEKAVAIAKDANSKLSFVFVDVDKVVLTFNEEQTLNKQLTAIADQCGYPVTETLAVLGDLHVKLSGIAKERNIDLVVCGHRHKLLSRFFSSIPKVANAIETDLLVVYLEP